MAGKTAPGKCRHCHSAAHLVAKAERRQDQGPAVVVALVKRGKREPQTAAMAAQARQTRSPVRRFAAVAAVAWLQPRRLVPGRRAAGLVVPLRWRQHRRVLILDLVAAVPAPSQTKPAGKAAAAS